MTHEEHRHRADLLLARADDALENYEVPKAAALAAMAQAHALLAQIPDATTRAAELEIENARLKALLTESAIRERRQAEYASKIQKDTVWLESLLARNADELGDVYTPES